MGWFQDWFSYQEPSTPVQPVEQKLTRFSAVGSDFDTFNTFEQWTALVNGWSGTRVSRAAALSVPAITRARNVFCRVGSLPLHVITKDGEKIQRPLLTVPELYKGNTRGYTMSMTVDDLFFYGYSLWRVVDREWAPADRIGFPTVVERIPRDRWDYDETTNNLMVDGKKLSPLDAILFKSHNPGLLHVGAGAVAALIALEATAAQRISQPQAREYFRSTTNQDPSDEEVRNFLSDINAARRANVSGWLPDGIERISTDQPTPQDLQLIEARGFSIQEVSRLTGLSTSWLSTPLGGSSTSYRNSQSERQDLVDFQAAPYLHAIEQRLSLQDVTPNGQRVLYNLDGFLRGNTTERYAAHSQAVGGQPFLTINEVRGLENLPPVPGGDVLPQKAPATDANSQQNTGSNS